MVCLYEQNRFPIPEDPAKKLQDAIHEFLCNLYDVDGEKLMLSLVQEITIFQKSIMT